MVFLLLFQSVFTDCCNDLVDFRHNFDTNLSDIKNNFSDFGLFTVFGDFHNGVNHTNEGPKSASAIQTFIELLEYLMAAPVASVHGENQYSSHLVSRVL